MSGSFRASVGGSGERARWCSRSNCSASASAYCGKRERNSSSPSGSPASSRRCLPPDKYECVLGRSGQGREGADVGLGWQPVARPPSLRLVSRSASTSRGSGSERQEATRSAGMAPVGGETDDSGIRGLLVVGID